MHSQRTSLRMMLTQSTKIPLMVKKQPFILYYSHLYRPLIKASFFNFKTSNCDFIKKTPQNPKHN